MSEITQTISTVTVLPEPPNPNAPSTFDALAYPYTVAQNAFGVDVNDMATELNTFATEANAVKDEINTAKDAVDLSESNALASEQKAALWAEGVGEVETGKYSSKHWADVAEQVVAVLPDGTISDGTVSTVDTWSSSKIDTLMQSKLSVDGGNMNGAINTARATVASHATTAQIWAASGNQIDYSGTATATIFPNAPQAGAERTLICSGACAFTAGDNMLIDGVASGTTVTCALGDTVIVRAISTTQFKLTIIKADGTGMAATSAYNIQVFTSSGTWTKPAGASMVRIILGGGGGGGGSGAKSGTTNAYTGLGGGGGGGGAVCDITLPISLLNATESVTVGAGGTKGTGLQSGTPTNGYLGIDGTDGGSTSFKGFTVGGGKKGLGGNIGISYVSSGNGDGGNSYIEDLPDTYFYTSAFVITRVFSGCSTTISSYNSRVKNSIYGGGSCPNSLFSPNSIYETQSDPVYTIYGGAGGTFGRGITLPDGSIRKLVQANVLCPPKKFLPSYFGNYQSVGGSGGNLASISSVGASGTSGTGYCSGGGGGSGSDQNNTPGNGGNGSGGLAIIISW